MLHPDNRPKFKEIKVIYGARTPGMLLYKDEIEEWAQRDDIDMYLTVDSTQDPTWKHRVGFVPAVTEEVAPNPDNTYALVCGPPVMIRFTQPVFGTAGLCSRTDHHVVWK